MIEYLFESVAVGAMVVETALKTEAVPLSYEGNLSALSQAENTSIPTSATGKNLLNSFI
jgi:hypothetical protein